MVLEEPALFTGKLVKTSQWHKQPVGFDNKLEQDKIKLNTYHSIAFIEVFKN